MLPNVFDAHRTLLAIGWLRGIEVPLNTAYVGSLLEYAVNLADITILVATAEYADRIREIAPRLTTLQTVVIIDGAPLAPLPFRTIERADFLAGAEPAEGLEGPEYSDVTALLFTSGTTGPSKAVITPWAVIHQFWSFPPDDAIGPGEGLYCALPLFHNSGRGAFNFTLVHGAKLIMRDKFSATHVWDDVRRCDAKVLALVGPLTSLVYSAPGTGRRRGQSRAHGGLRADDPRDRGVREAVRRQRPDLLRAVGDRHCSGDRLGPRSLGQLRSSPTRLPVARGRVWSTTWTNRSGPGWSES